MARASERPKLRAVEAVIVPDGEGRALLLRDTEGVATGAVLVPGHLLQAVARFDGLRSIEAIAIEATRASGEVVTADMVAELAKELDDALFLESPRYAKKRREIVDAFLAAPVRPASHAGGAYHGDARALSRFIDDECLAKAPARKPKGRMVALAAPHMDLWRAAVGYGHAYRACAEALAPEVDTFVLLGTCHAPMRRPFAVCDKAFATPLGELPPDRDAIRELSRASRFDVREDEYFHKQEHSLEFQAVFLRHLLGARPATIVPVLCGLGEAQARGRDPSRDAAAESFLAALTELVAKRGDRVLLVAGADLAHVGPRFGDARPLDAAERRALATRDRRSIGLALDGDAPSFFADVAEDLDTRRVCGLGPLYTMLRAMPGAPAGELLHYDQHVDSEEGSIVSHAALGFYA
jgi:AmmeMemoRadiSam system protein B